MVELMSKETIAMYREKNSARRGLRTLPRVGLTSLLGAFCLVGFLAFASSTLGAVPVLDVRSDHYPSFTPPGGTVNFMIQDRNVGTVASKGDNTVEVRLPSGLTTDVSHITDELALDPNVGEIYGKAWKCEVSSEGRNVNCTLPADAPLGTGFLGAMTPGRAACRPTFSCRILIEATVAPDAPGGVVVSKACGGGALRCAYDTDQAPSGVLESFNLMDWDSSWTVDANGDAFTQAGGHPYAVINDFDLNRFEEASERIVPFGNLKNVVAKLPSGFIGAPNAMPTCHGLDELTPNPGEGADPLCSTNAIVGSAEVRFSPSFAASSTDAAESVNIPIFNMDPPVGVPAQFAFQIHGFPAFLNARLRSDGDFGVNITSTNISQGIQILGVKTNFWGVPSDHSHDIQRCVSHADEFCRGEVGTPNGPHPADAGTPKPFLTNPSKCTVPGKGADIPLHVDSWDKPTISDEMSFTTHSTGDPASREAVGNDGCEIVPFDPKITVQPSTDQADSPTGFEVVVTVPKDGINNPDGIAQSSLRDATVTLPEGMTLNPSYGDGVATCSPDQIGLTTGNASEVHFNLAPNHCPDAAQLGSVHIETPLLDFPLDGGMYLAEQNDPAKPGVENPFDGLLAVYLVASEPLHGVQVKLAGEIKRDRDTGQVTTVFEDNPQIAFSKLVVKFKGGQRSALATPSNCGIYTTVGEFTSYARPDETVKAIDSLRIARGADGNASSCVSRPEERPFRPTLIAGTENNTAGSFSPFALRMLRKDGEQEITTFSADLPPGLSARLKGIPKCSDAAIEAAKHHSGREEKLHPSCPAASQVGQTLVGAGTGSILTYSPGKIYLAGPYKGTPLSIVTITPATVGPFDLDTVVVRSAFRIDPDDAQVHVDSRASDPIPHIFQGIALHIREIRVLINRPGFTINPTNCSRFEIGAHLTGTGATFGNVSDDVPVDLSVPYEAADCQALEFKPKLTFQLKGGTHRGDFPEFRATLKARPGDANIDKTSVVLPRSEFIEQNHIKTVCTRVQFAANQCPPGSIYGYAKATTPLLDQPVEGPVYLRSNGGERILPDLVAALHGEINVDLVGYVDSIKGKVRNRFEVIPDAPVSTFTLRMKGGKKGLLVNHLNLCKVTSKADVKMIGQNGKTFNTTPKMGTSCKAKGRNKKQKRR